MWAAALALALVPVAATQASDQAAFDARFEAALKVCAEVVRTRGASLKDETALARLGFTRRYLGEVMSRADSPGISVFYHARDALCGLEPTKGDVEAGERFRTRWTALVKRNYPDVDLAKALTESNWIPVPIHIKDDNLGIDVLLILAHMSKHGETPETYVASVSPVPKD